MKPVQVGGVVYDAPHLRSLAEQLVQLRDAALGQGAFDWAVILTHSIGVMNASADAMEEL